MFNTSKALRVAAMMILMSSSQVEASYAMLSRVQYKYNSLTGENTADVNVKVTAMTGAEYANLSGNINSNIDAIYVIIPTKQLDIVTIVTSIPASMPLVMNKESTFTLLSDGVNSTAINVPKGAIKDWTLELP